jgi:diadenosine tetraphosphate (Ap4A) HIT family hydrolase
MPDCIFCKIAAKDIPSYTVWESETHMAFLTLWPNTDGFTVVIPKAHFGSYIFEQESEVVNGMMAACKEVAGKIDRAFDDVGRTGVIFEGFGVNHLHAKLVPMHGTKSDEWKQHKSDNRAFYTTYPGYITSHDSVEADKEHLAKIAEKITSA